MKNYTMILAIGVVLILIVSLTQFGKILFTERPSLWIYECLSFSILSVILSGSAYVFKPDERSASLAEVDELLDETLTEMGDTTDRPRMSVGIGRPDLQRISEVEMEGESPAQTDLKERNL